MTARHTPWLLALSFGLAACTDPANTDDDKLVIDSVDSWIDWPDDTDDDTGTDEDTDGWTVEDGDCDDNNIYVNPGRDEDPSDGLDNDCDGRVDEVYQGLVILQQGNGASPAQVVFLDDFGEQERAVSFDDPDLIPYFMTEGVNGGWLIGTLGNYDGNAAQLALYEVDASGSTSLLAEFDDTDVWAFGLYGITTHPDGYYLACTGDSLQAVEPGTGMLTPLATWDPETEIFSFDVDVDLLTGEVGIYGYYGGFATIDEVGAVQTRALGNPSAPEHVMFSGKRWGGQGWFAGGFDADGFGVFRFNENGGRWVRRVDFTGQDDLWNPRFMTIDDINDGIYITTTEATYPTVWRIPADGGEASAFFLSDIRDNNFALWDLYTRF